MITSIFSKSKPINFLIVFSLSLLALLIATNKYSNIVLNTTSVFKLIAVFACCFLSILLVDFIVTKNSLSQKGNTEVLLFSIFLLTVPQVFLKWEVVLSNFLVLLALRRIISLRTQKEHIKKLFDAGFLIGLASLFYFWSLLFFLLIFIALLFYSESEIKKWITPFLGLLAIIILSISTSIIIKDDFFSYLNINPKVGFNFTVYNSIQFIVAITVLLSFGLWSSLFYLKDINKKKKTFRPSYKVIFMACVVASLIVIISPKKNGSEFLFLFGPLTIIFSNYIETIEEKWFKTLFVVLLLIVPVVLLML
ncbi:hypothetical protein CLV86_1807 [Lacinutrix venerupis]|uniref:DUF6427 family protein n=1 Tax=Lacinutrix venerupis TaxID=1486034 RepID=UPI000EAC56FA|nr:DUF6427 family protein [Lacinutrix venerupis]RLJ63270.1 hypothetical protein CLV86_1807 [Lacinutrix venerupis]